MSGCNWCGNSCPMKNIDKLFSIEASEWNIINENWKINRDKKDLLRSQWISPCIKCIKEIDNTKTNVDDILNK